MAGVVAKPDNASDDFVRAGYRDGLAYASGWCGEHHVPRSGHFFSAKSETKRRFFLDNMHARRAHVAET